ncbi:tail assembly chaperone protein [Pseudomonas phage vB_PsaM_M1]|nr:tail assembly chaperone protein [Pseudomonas phage vB_PsaM_M1]
MAATDEIRKLTEEFSQDFEVMRVLTFEPRLCTKYELEHLYTLDDFHDFVEIIDAQETLKDEANKAQQAKQQKAQNKKG